MRSFTLPFLSLCFLCLGAVAGPILSPWVVHEKRYHVPSGWAQSHKLDPTVILPLRFGLAQPNIQTIGEYLNDIAHPDSPNYGNHWSAAQVAVKFAPSAETIETVTNWLLDSGFTIERIRLTNTKGWIELNATVQETEDLLNTEYHVYKHSSGKEHVSCKSYHLPAHVAPHVELVTPTVHFNAILSRSTEPSHLDIRGSGSIIKLGVPGEGFSGPKSAGVISEIFDQLEKCDQQITPLCLRALYDVAYQPLAAEKNSYAISEYSPQAYVPSDIDNFGKTYAPDLVGQRPVFTSIDGGVDQTTNTGFNYNGESNLDLQYGMALVTAKQKVTLYQVGDPIASASFNNLLDALDGSYCTFEGGDDPAQDAVYPDPAPGGYKGQKACGTVTPAHVMSTSYTYNEADLTPFYAARQCAEYAKLGLMGVTVLFSSGDNGVAGNSGTCLNPDGTQTANGKIFNPTFPPSCPFVTAVGATQVNPGSSVFEPESACEQVIYSGGGFSNYFAMPQYQQEYVQHYLNEYPPPYSKDIYNSTGRSRAYPDLAANGANYVVSVQGQFELVFGTSASSPVVGAILTLVNDARLFLNKKPIGFINPTIYSPSFIGAFHDITNGTNQGCGTVGFKATEGWDPVTGLGTPNFPELVKRWVLLP